MARRKQQAPACIPQLLSLGFTPAEAYALRRAAMTLHRWYELECGVEAGGVERDERTGRCIWYNSRTGTRTPYRDMERPALTRVSKIMEAHPHLLAYHQTDPRGAPLYVLRPGDVPQGEHAESYYSRGIPVYK